MKASEKKLGGVTPIREQVLFPIHLSEWQRQMECLWAETRIVGLTFHDLRHEATSRLFEKGLNPVRSGYDYRAQRYKDADALYPFKSRGFGEETGVSYRRVVRHTTLHPLLDVIVARHCLTSSRPVGFRLQWHWSPNRCQ